MQAIQIELTKREIGFLYASISHRVRHHEFYGKIGGADFSEIKLYLSELVEMAELAQKMYSYFFLNIENDIDHSEDLTHD